MLRPRQDYYHDPNGFDYSSNLTTWFNKTKLTRNFNLSIKKELIPSLIKKGRLSKLHAKLVYQLWDTLESLYPGKCDVQFELKPSFKIQSNQYGMTGAKEFKVFDKFTIANIYPIVYFPDIEITNSKGDTYTIKDLYVRVEMSVRENRVEIGQIQGTRTTLNHAEIQAMYLHSHLQRRNMSDINERLNFTKFCLGTGEMVAIISMLNSTEWDEDHRRLRQADGVPFMDDDTLRLMLINMETYVKWESIEGGPHCLMQEVFLKDYGISKYSMEDVANYAKNIIDRTTRSHCLEAFNKIKWVYRNGKYSIIDDNNLDEYLRTYNNVLPNLFYFKDENGRYFKRSTIAKEDTQHKENEWIPFRNQKIHFKLDGEFREPTANAPIYLHPKIKKYVVHRLEYAANYKEVRKSAIKAIS